MSLRKIPEGRSKPDGAAPSTNGLREAEPGWVWLCIPKRCMPTSLPSLFPLSPGCWIWFLFPRSCRRLSSVSPFKLKKKNPYYTQFRVSVGFLYSHSPSSATPTVPPSTLWFISLGLPQPLQQLIHREDNYTGGKRTS